MYSISKKIFAEILGTFVLVFIGCGTAVVTGCSVENTGAYLLTALAFGLSVMAMAYAVGKVSGGHFNPAVTLGVVIKGEETIVTGLIYMISQCLGAILAGGALYMLLGSETGLGTNALYQNSIPQSMVIEIILTCIFVFVILSITDGIVNKQISGLIIGLTLTLVHIMGIAFTGTSVNPARSLGVALFVGGDALANVWVFIVAPLIGAVIAGILYKFIVKIVPPNAMSGIKEDDEYPDTLTDGDKLEAKLSEEMEDLEETIKLDEADTESEGGITEKLEEVKEDIKEETSDVAEKVEETVEKVEEKAAEVKGAVSETVENAKEAVSDKVAEISEKVGDAKEEVKEAEDSIKEVAKESKEELSKMVKEEVEKK